MRALFEIIKISNSNTAESFNDEEKGIRLRFQDKLTREATLISVRYRFSVRNRIQTGNGKLVRTVFCKLHSQ